MAGRWVGGATGGITGTEGRAGGTGAAGRAAAGAGAALPFRDTGITVAQTWQRARTPAAGTLAGSTR
jgi:hypothetical protein